MLQIATFLDIEFRSSESFALRPKPVRAGEIFRQVWGVRLLTVVIVFAYGGSGVGGKCEGNNYKVTNYSEYNQHWTIQTVELV
jgi:hypothetical protein